LNLTLAHRENLTGPVAFFDLFGEATDWKDYCNALSDDTVEKLQDKWRTNIIANAPYIRRSGSAYDRYRGLGQDKACVIIGASPALKNNFQTLCDLQHDSRFILVACSSSLKFLLDKGIKPKFVLMMDGAADVARYINVGDKSKGITLIAACLVHPKSLKQWQGNVRFVRVDAGKKFEKEYIRLTKIKDAFPGGGTQFNAAVLFSYMTLQSHVLIFMGNELAYDEQYYLDRKDEKDKHFQKYPWMGIDGSTCYTNHNFIASKLWLEDTLGKWKGVFINATEAGILGSSQRYGQLPYILQMKIANAVDYTRRAIDKFKEVN
jgi:hypothetical protein